MSNYFAIRDLPDYIIEVIKFEHYRQYCDDPEEEFNLSKTISGIFIWDDSILGQYFWSEINNFCGHKDLEALINFFNENVDYVLLNTYGLGKIDVISVSKSERLFTYELRKNTCVYNVTIEKKDNIWIVKEVERTKES